MDDFILRVEGLWKNFGGLTAVSDYHLHLPQGATFGLIGPNGAGKTTIFNLISGVIKPTKGKIFFKGRNITSFRPDQIAALGLTRTFQNLRLFPSLSVEMNLKIGAHVHAKCGFVSTLLSLPSLFREEKVITERAQNILEVFELEDYRNELCSNLPYGLQRKLDIARSLMTEPEVLFLDEPSAGMNDQEAEELAQVVREIKERFRLTLVIVEHRMPFVMGLAEVIQVLDYGSIIASGSPEEVRNNPKVVEAYLGTGDLIA
ncbi:MAG: branched-chain amino acid transport system ATP-binding protein [Candidatus Atribacteria bacterium]|nr:branched-chain amino acid transport system ATP-binding protein [Candidatus Atribacteria bacterium]